MTPYAQLPLCLHEKRVALLKKMRDDALAASAEQHEALRKSGFYHGLETSEEHVPVGYPVLDNKALQRITYNPAVTYNGLIRAPLGKKDDQSNSLSIQARATSVLGTDSFSPYLRQIAMSPSAMKAFIVLYGGSRITRALRTFASWRPRYASQLQHPNTYIRETGGLARLGEDLDALSPQDHQALRTFIVALSQNRNRYVPLNLDELPDEHFAHDNDGKPIRDKKHVIPYLGLPEKRTIVFPSLAYPLAFRNGENATYVDEEPHVSSDNSDTATTTLGGDIFFAFLPHHPAVPVCSERAAEILSETTFTDTYLTHSVHDTLRSWREKTGCGLTRPDGTTIGEHVYTYDTFFEPPRPVRKRRLFATEDVKEQLLTETDGKPVEPPQRRPRRRGTETFIVAPAAEPAAAEPAAAEPAAAEPAAAGPAAAAELAVAAGPAAAAGSAAAELALSNESDTTRDSPSQIK